MLPYATHILTRPTDQPILAQMWAVWFGARPSPTYGIGTPIGFITRERS
jgi:hypothetical protein